MSGLNVTMVYNGSQPPGQEVGKGIRDKTGDNEDQVTGVWELRENKKLSTAFRSKKVGVVTRWRISTLRMEVSKR